MNAEVLNPAFAPDVVELISRNTYRNAMDWELTPEEARYNMWAYLEEFFDLEEAHLLFQLTDNVVKKISDVREALQ